MKKEFPMSTKRVRLPSRLPAGSKYILESRGTMKGLMLVNRYVELPDGRRIELDARLVPTSESKSGKESGKTKVGSPSSTSILAEAFA
jgi:hypothetical protein